MFRWLIASLSVIALIGVVAFVVVGRDSAEPFISTELTKPIGDNSGGVAEGRLLESDREAAKAWYQKIRSDNDWSEMDLRSIAAEQAVSDQRFEIALSYLGPIPDDDPKYGLNSRLLEATTLVSLDRAVDAERALKNYLSLCRERDIFIVDDVVLAYKWLNYLLSVQLRLEDRKVFLEQVHLLGIADLQDSKQLFFPNLLILNSPAGRAKIENYFRSNSESTAIGAARGRYQTLAGDFQLGQQYLLSLREKLPADRPVMAALLELYFDAGMVDEFDALAKDLPDFSADEPWLLTRMRGEYFLEAGKDEQAAECFEHVLSRDPANTICQMGTATAYGNLQRERERDEAMRRSAVLAKIRVNLNKVQNDKSFALQELIEHCEAIGFTVARDVFKLHFQKMFPNGGQVEGESADE